MTYLPSGKIEDGPLSTDRPNTASAYGYYRLKWMHMVTNLGFTQICVPGHADQYLPAGGRHLFGLPVGGRPRQFREPRPRRQWQHIVNGDVVTTRARIH